MELGKSRIVISYHLSDDILRDKLARFLRPLIRKEYVEIWSDQDLLPGVDVAQARKNALESATHILLLLSAEYVASDLCWREMLSALKLHECGEAHVVPILLRPCFLLPETLKTKQGESLSYLPSHGQPVTTWKESDEAFLNVTKGICRILRLPFATLGHRSTDRDDFLDIVFKTWIEGLLAHSLQGRSYLDLPLQERPDALVNPWAESIQELHLAPLSLPPGTSIAQVYDQTNGELLILGEAGSGKTTLLLELTRMLLVRAEEDERARMPVVFHLSSWAKKEQASLGTWLVEELTTKYGVPRTLGQRWVSTNQILPLLDGLDEVAESARVPCVRAIKAYRAQTQRELVVCCRYEKYFVLPERERLTLRRAFCIQQLTDNQIDHYLQQAEQNADTSLQDLQQTLNNSEELRKLARRPLMLNILTVAYQGATAAKVPTGKTPEEMQCIIFAQYVERVLNRRGKLQHWKPKQVIRYLTFLAARMRRFQQSTFYQENLTAHWIGNQGGLLLQMLSLWLIACLPGSLIVGHFSGLTAGLFFLFILTLFTWGRVSTPPMPDREMEQRIANRRANTSSLLQTLRVVLVESLGCGFGGVLLIGIIGILMVGFSKGLVNGLVNGLVFSLEGLLFFGINALLHPADGPIDYSALAIFAALSVPIFGFAVGLTCWLIAGPSVGLFCGLLIELVAGIAVLSPFLLHLWLWCTDSLPWRRVSFLDETVNYLLMYKVGRGYIFIHRLLLDYFANLSKQEQKEERFYQDLLASQQQRLGPTHPKTQNTRKNFAAFLRLRGRDEEAKKLEEYS